MPQPNQCPEAINEMSPHTFRSEGMKYEQYILAPVNGQAKLIESPCWNWGEADLGPARGDCPLTAVGVRMTIFSFAAGLMNDTTDAAGTSPDASFPPTLRARKKKCLAVSRPAAARSRPDRKRPSTSYERLAGKVPVLCFQDGSGMNGVIDFTAVRSQRSGTLVGWSRLSAGARQVKG